MSNRSNPLETSQKSQRAALTFLFCGDSETLLSRLGRDAATSEGQVPKATRSSARRDKRSMLETFKQLIQVVERIPGYNPNDAEFKVAGLKLKLAELQSSMDAVSATSIAYREALIARDELMLNPDGVVETTKLAVEYVRGKFGYNSIRSKKFGMQASNV